MNVYTDGSCFRNGYPDAKAGYGVHFSGKDWDISHPLRWHKHSNNTAEMYAVYAALKRLYFNDVRGQVTIHCDSKIVVDGFIKRKNRTAANYDLWLKLYKAYDVVSKQCKVNIVKIKGHNGDPGNEKADELAGEGAKKK